MKVFYGFDSPDIWKNRVVVFFFNIFCWLINSVTTVNGEHIKPDDKILAVTICKIEIIKHPVKWNG